MQSEKRPSESDLLLRENEISNNQVASTVMLIIGILLILIACTDWLGQFYLGEAFVARLFVFCGVVDLAVFFLGHHFHFRPSWFKTLVLVSALLTSGIDSFLYPQQAPFLTYGPIVISAMYYDTGLILKTTFVSWILYTIVIWSNVILEKVSPVMQQFHRFLETTVWRNPLEVLRDYYVVHCVLFVSTGLICHRIARKGSELLYKQAASSAAMAEIAAQMKAAEAIQRSNLPSRHLNCGDMTVNGLMRPAKSVGGDFFDYFRLGDDLIFLVADVSDKGLSAAMFMMRAKNDIRTSVQMGEGLVSAVGQTNKALCEENESGMFVTLWIGQVNVYTGKGKFVNCGHPAPLLLSREKADWLSSEPCPPLGLFDEARYTVHPFALKPDEMLFAYTDGMTDALNPDGEEFGAEGLKKAVESLQRRTVSPMDELVEAVDSFADGTEQFDDMTVLVVHAGEEKVTGEFCLNTADRAGEKAIDGVNGLLAQVDCPDNTRREIDTILDEICSNICENAYPGGSGPLCVQLRASEGKAMLTVSDKGVDFNPLEHEADSDDPLEGVGGFGIRLICGMADEVAFSREYGENRLRVVKRWMQ